MAQDDPPYRRTDQPTERRVEDLLSRMTLEEKAGQVVGTWAGERGETHDIPAVRNGIVEHGFGSVAAFGWAGAAVSEPREVVEAVNDLQGTAIEETRLGIPLLVNVDAVHGHAYVEDATVFPNGLGAAATWDPALIERSAAATAREVRATGAHQNYAPTCDVAREPRWGRVQETHGESPRLAADFAGAKVRGLQGEEIDDPESVLATAKHFPAYSDPERGQDGAPVEVSECVLRNTFLPPFEAAIDAGVESVMPAYSATNGEPAHSSRYLLTERLRDELGFDGHVVADWSGVKQLHQSHGVTTGWRESVRRTREAGLDVGSVDHTVHVEKLVELVEDGQLDEAILDDSVRRVLRVKFELGLFEDPYVDVEETVSTLGCDEHRELARKTARQSMTLLENDGILPLSGDETVFVGGPNADDLVHQVGGWSHHEADGLAGVTVREAIEARAAGEVLYEQGATLTEERDVDDAVEKASQADVAVLGLGEGWYIHEFGPQDMLGTDTGEWPTRSELRLPPAQRRLAEEIHETGTPVVGVLLTGRPLIVDWLADHADALLLAYFPGTEGGQAVAETLFGDCDPGGRLPISIARSHGDLPQLHDHARHPLTLGADEHPDSYDPLYPFGHGLNYTTFERRDLELDETTVRPDGTVSVAMTVENVGSRPGEDVIQVYGGQKTPSRVRPERELVGYDRVALDPGEARTIEVEIPVEHFGFYKPGEGHVVESDTYAVTVADMEAAFTVERVGNRD
ncbi:beta-glucosidase protein [Halorhabdus tiamatea SARL4B]|uniref:beta-glucosidase n=1 Tax=Halorhabdus tiamatea SARL4B TaxID=1033806 RepID=F7PIP9_9EURY|nr:glycoside hydrolase family 3 N-terminal domain-containing protein [Halorhabdus tiamatea]ERJ04780.1 beta-glucosidase protein [Halorhabdus tiamatea SARL4B]CCQ33380.1 beta-glucosidase, family GH3 [Halorhabdus tiamatea SARL4B]